MLNSSFQALPLSEKVKALNKETNKQYAEVKKKKKKPTWCWDVKRTLTPKHNNHSQRANQLALCYKKTHKFTVRTFTLVLTLQQCEKIWQIYSWVYRDLLSRAMRCGITVASWMEGKGQTATRNLGVKHMWQSLSARVHSKASHLTGIKSSLFQEQQNKSIMAIRTIQAWDKERYFHTHPWK